jgi:VCBS repeat protein
MSTPPRVSLRGLHDPSRSRVTASGLRLLCGLLIVGLAEAPGASGASIVTPTLHRRLDGATGLDRLGKSLDSSDLDGDGVPDAVIGAPGSMGTGAVYAFSGASGGSLLTIPGFPGSRSFGAEVDVVGDTNGDGVPDLLVAELGARQAYLFSGAEGSRLLPGTTFAYVVEPDAGFSMDGMGDVDGDGSADFAIAGRGGAGAAAVYSGATGEVLVPLDPAPSEAFIGSVTALGDLDGDGVSDLAAGRVGSTGVYSGASGRGLFSLDAYDVLAAADVDGDGLRDVLVGMPVAPADAVVFAYSGRTGALLRRATIASQSGCAQDVCHFRIALAGIGDVDDDGCEDLAASLATADLGASTAAGTVVVLSGASGARLARIDGKAPMEHTGWSLAGPGDVDRDGVPDLWVGSPGGGAALGGSALLYRLLRGPLPAALDVLPAACPNLLPARGGHPILVAVMGGADLPVDDIDPASVRLSGIAPVRERRRSMDASPAAPPGACLCPSEQPDGFPDRVFVFDADAVRYALGSASTLTLTATLPDGRSIEGSDCALLEGTARSASPARAMSPLATMGLASPNPARIGQSITIRVEAWTNGPSVPLSIFDVHGRRVAEVFAAPRETGVGGRWDGRDQRGIPVTPGCFFVRSAGGAIQTRILLLP